MPALNSLTIAEMEVMASRFLYAAAIFGTRLCDCYFFKAVRRRLSALNRGIVQETSPANVPPAAVGLGERLRHMIENIIASETSIPQKRHRPPSSRMHRSMDGEPFLFQTPATLKLPEGNGEEAVSYHAGLGARGTLSLNGLSRRLATHYGHWVDNTLLQGGANKGRSKSHAMTWELQRIYDFWTLAEYRHPLPTCGLHKGNPADGMSRGRVFTLQDVAKGWNLRRAAAESFVWRTPKSAIS
ncbi:putative target of rapamycin (TOR) kinase 1 [Trypanosoma cruzi]|uniref:Putative target of rapamycin (TOR) kinase 1 n=1 Tax=Trypanosoma cruzi TaxID=5693 RepID=A0A2V2WE02_TRYCR|nr:putative target of rapamycin (TOR) kinase 1 [Trypanosoma cruzi]